jgi:chorismate synthase
MAGNTFGTLFKLTTYGESHGAAIGGVIDGCPAGLEVDMEFIQRELDRRKPGQSELTTPRKEEDKIQILSGVFEGKTTGAPIGFVLLNNDQKSGDYDHLKEVYRPSHADYTYQQKYGIRDHRGSGRASARETVSRVVGGAFAKLILKQRGIEVLAYVSAVKDIALNKPYHELDLGAIESNAVRCPDKHAARLMAQLISTTRDNGDSVGGTITCICKGVPAGLGEPVFDKLNALLAHAMLSINAVKAFEMGDGKLATTRFGSENNDAMSGEHQTNHDGGVQGGISNGKDVVMHVSFKPTSTIAKPQETRNTSNEAVVLQAKGRHDPCVLPRAVPIVESMAAMVLVDLLLRSKGNKLEHI